jgi:hypothetical protein
MQYSRITCGIGIAYGLVLIGAITGCSAENASNPEMESSPLSGDYIYFGTHAEAQIKIQVRELTVAERDAQLEEDLLLVDYLPTIPKGSFTAQGFAKWLEAQGRYDVVERVSSASPAVTGDVAQAKSPLIGNTSSATCSSLPFKVSTVFKIYTGSDFTGSQACIIDNNTGTDLDLGSLGGGVFLSSVRSIIPTPGIAWIEGSRSG